MSNKAILISLICILSIDSFSQNKTGHESQNMTPIAGGGSGIVDNRTKLYRETFEIVWSTGFVARI